MRITFTLDELNCMISAFRSIPYRPLPSRDFALLEKLEEIRKKNTWKPCQCKGN